MYKDFYIKEAQIKTSDLVVGETCFITMNWWNSVFSPMYVR